jgi:hypothetical protein
VEAFIQQNFIITMGLDPIVTLIVMFHAAISTAIIWIVLRSIHQKNQQALRLRYMVKNWGKTGEAQQIFLLIAIIVPMAYGIFKVGLIGYLRFGVMDYYEIATYSPYWYTALWPFLPVLIYSVALSAVAKISYRRSNAVTWIILLVAFLLCVIYGRRPVFYLILLSGIIWYFPRGNLFTLKKSKFFILLICVIIIFSNIYQTYRQDILSASINLVESWGDMSATMLNLQERIGPWYLNYRIIDSDSMPMYGAFFLNSMKNSIPRLFWPGKVVYDEDVMLADHYSLPPIDYPNNPLSTILADFGILSAFIIPLFYLFVYISAAYFLNKFRRYPLLYLVLSVMLLQFIINFESSFYAEIFGLYRYGSVVVILYFMGWFLLKYFKLIVKEALKINNIEGKVKV